MALDPAQLLNSNNVYQSGQNDNYNSGNPAEKLQSSEHKQSPKARTLSNNKNIDGAKSSISLLKKIGKKIRSSCRNIASQSYKDKQLFSAIENGETKCAREWIKAGAFVGEQGLFTAVSKGHTGVVKLLLLDPDIDMTPLDYNDRSLISWAARNGHADVVKELLTHPNSCNKIKVNQLDCNDRSPLYWAARNGHADVVKELLPHPNSCNKIKVNQLDRDGVSPLIAAAKEGHTDVVKLLLLDPDIDVNQLDRDGVSPLIAAAKEGHADVVKELLTHPNSCNKIKVNQLDRDGVSPLIAAAKEGHADVVKLLLLDPDIDIIQLDYNRRSPLYWAAKEGHVGVVKELLTHPKMLTHPKIKMDNKERKYVDRLIAHIDVDSIQEIVLNGCSKNVYKYLYTKANEADNPQLINWFKKRQHNLVSGYANTKAFDGHNESYIGKEIVHEDLLNIIKEYLNPDLSKKRA